MIRRPPGSPLFPYPTLFRSTFAPGSGSPDPLSTTRPSMTPGRSEAVLRSEEHTSELQSPYVISHAVFFLNDTAPTGISTLPLPDALPIYFRTRQRVARSAVDDAAFDDARTVGSGL